MHLGSAAQEAVDAFARRILAEIYANYSKGTREQWLRRRNRHLLYELWEHTWKVTWAIWRGDRRYLREKVADLGGSVLILGDANNVLDEPEAKWQH